MNHYSILGNIKKIFLNLLILSEKRFLKILQPPISYTLGFSEAFF